MAWRSPASGAYWLSWMTTFGGKTFDENNKAIFDADPKSMETLTWIFDGIKNETITYGGSLPKGQGIDALFFAGQLATAQMGRWILPEPEEAEDRLRHRAVPVGGRQVDRTGERPGGGHGRELQGQGLRLPRSGGPPGT